MGKMRNESLPTAPRHGLSKSRIAAFEQCPKRLWLQVHRRELAETDAGKELRFAAGHEVGEVACSLVPGGIMIEAVPDLATAVARTAELLRSPNQSALFEATFVHDDVLVRLDVMEPHEDGSWHVAEVKSATSRKDCYVTDLATQLWVLRENGVQVRSAAIRHLNNQFLLENQGQFDGLLVDVPTLEDAEELVATRAEVVSAARAALSGPEPEIAIGDHCHAPYSCEFRGFCSQLSVQPGWPIELLPSTGRKVAAKWAEQGVVDLTEVPPGSFDNRLHARIHEATCTGLPYHDPDGVKAATAGWSWPRSYLDFETIAFAIPKWIGTRPWQQVPFQFSVDIQSECGGLDHHEFLRLDGADPRRACAEALLAALPSSGAIITYSASFERSRVKELASLFPDLRYELDLIAARIVDLLPVTRNHWYHRDQRGSWSIKAVLPTISDKVGYDQMAVGDGSAAQAAYLQATHPECPDLERGEIDRDLRAYCALDTRAMILLLDHLTQLKKHGTVDAASQ